MEEQQLMTGKCIKWVLGKGYGFITPDDGGGDLFVHQTEIKAQGFRSLQEGEALEFFVEIGKDGKRKAVKVSGPNNDYVRGAKPQRRGRGRDNMKSMNQRRGMNRGRNMSRIRGGSFRGRGRGLFNRGRGLFNRGRGGYRDRSRGRSRGRGGNRGRSRGRGYNRGPFNRGRGRGRGGGSNRDRGGSYRRARVFNNRARGSPRHRGRGSPNRNY